MEAPLNQELYEIYKKYCPRFVGFSGGIIKDDPRIKKFFDGRYEYTSCPNPLSLYKERFILKHFNDNGKSFALFLI